MVQSMTFLYPVPSPASFCKKVFLEGEIVRGPAISVSLTFLVTIFLIALNGFFLIVSIAQTLSLQWRRTDI